MSNSGFDPVFLAESAAATALAGTSAEHARARADLATAFAQSPTNIQILFYAFQFYFRTGDLDLAEHFANLRLQVAGPGTDSSDTARAYGNLGLIAHFRKSYEVAEERLRRAIEIDRRINDPLGLARDMGNLASVYESRGELDRAEQLNLEGLAVARAVPGARAEELAASKISNLGDIAKTRGDRAKAHALWTESKAIFDRLGITKWNSDFVKRFESIESRA